MLTLLSAELALVAFFTPAGRFHVDLGFYEFTTGYDAYKMFPLVFLTWLVWRARDWRRPWPDAKWLAPFGAFFICSLLAAIGSGDPYQTATESLEILCYLWFGLILVDLPWQRMRAGWIAAAFALGNLYLCGVALAQYLGADPDGAVLRLNAVFDHPNQLGGYAVVGAPILGWLASRTGWRWQQAALALIGAGVLAAGVLSLSRSSHLAMLAGVLCLFLLGTRSLRIVCVMLAGAGLIAVVIAGPALWSRFADLANPVQLQDDASRLQIWSALLDSTLPRLGFFGQGFGPVLQDQLNNWIASAQSAQLPRAQWGPHSTYLAVFLAAGVPGLLAYLWFLVSGAQTMNGCSRVERAWLLAGLVGAMVHQAFIFPLLTGNYPIALLSLFVIATLRSREEEPS